MQEQLNNYLHRIKRLNCWRVRKRGADNLDNWLEFVLFILASFRLTRLIVYDKIMEFLRRPFHRTIVDTLPDGTTEEYIEIKGTGFQYWIGELLSCHWCIGIWSSIIIYFGYLYLPNIASPIITILAIAGCASIIQALLEK